MDAVVLVREMDWVVLDGLLVVVPVGVVLEGAGPAARGDESVRASAGWVVVLSCKAVSLVCRDRVS
jgi:hypothetical protein